MKSTGTVLAVAALTTLAVGLIEQDGWPGYAIGAILSLALWVMLYFGSYATGGLRAVPPLVYAAASAVAVVLGGIVVWVSGGGGAFWGTGFILAGLLWPAFDTARRDRTVG